MYAKTFWVMQRLMASDTIGEFAKRTGMPYSSVRRYLENAVSQGFAGCAVVKYKSTGKRIFWPTRKGYNWIAGRDIR